MKNCLVANRGDIAVRIHRTARAMGITTYAIAPLFDAEGYHTKVLDHVLSMNGSTLQSSYLCIDEIIQLALDNNIECIHPGVGFLSENPDFAKACREAGIIFVGPSERALRTMGDKDIAKSTMSDAGVPVLPGYNGVSQDADILEEKANELGYPLLIKAVRGGGGKGMRRVDAAKDFRDACQRAQEESLKAFGSSSVILEKYCFPARHIEVQIMGDGQQAIHLYTRDCSLQRRHQKLIEEGPAPLMPHEIIESLQQAAVKAAEAVSYEGAGTVEFIVDPNNNFYFMEMNTRLQVEHPVTEMITGIDLVEWQFKIARGERLPCTQTQIKLHGHAIEARIICEDPDHQFLPVTGFIEAVENPFKEDPTIRLELGIQVGERIGLHFDPMIAKIIAHGDSRESARLRLVEALKLTQIAGLCTTQNFALKLITHPSFIEQRLRCDFIDVHHSELYQKETTPAYAWIAAALEYSGASINKNLADGPWTADGWQAANVHSSRFLINHKQTVFAISLKKLDECAWEAHVNESIYQVNIKSIAYRKAATNNASVENINQFEVDKVVTSYFAQRNNNFLHIVVGNERFDFELVDELQVQRHGISAHAGTLLAPMPGLIKHTFKNVGDFVKKDEPLLVMEAMKMEHILCAPFDGIVDRLNHSNGNVVEAGIPLLHIKEHKS